MRQESGFWIALIGHRYHISISYIEYQYIKILYNQSQYHYWFWGSGNF